MYHLHLQIPVKITHALCAALLFTLMTASTPSWAAPVHTGTITETMNAGGYTYVLLKKDGEKQWVALPESKVKVGETISYVQGVVMKNFSSSTLKRTFDSIIFSEGIAADKPIAKNGGKDPFTTAVEAEKKPEEQPEKQQAMSPGSDGAVTPFMELKIDKAVAENGYTVEEIFTKKESLKDKTVTVRGKIMKINTAIMGKNWVHLQDGTGNPMHNTHDLVLTTTETLPMGEVVTLTGKVTVDRDFGYSYKYALLIEDATLVPVSK